MKRGLHLFFICLAAGLRFGAAQAVIFYNTAGSVYNQHFDGLPSSGSFSLNGKGPIAFSAPPINATGMAGWQLLMTGGSGSNAVFAPGTGSSTGNGIYSFGSSGSAERALGSLAASTGIYAFGLILTNNTGSLLNSCTIRFTTEQWRRGGSGNRGVWAFGFKLGTFSSIDQPALSNEHALDIISMQTASGAATLNGNLPDNQQIISCTLRNIVWKNGEQLLLRWDDADEPGSDDACALDNFSFSATKETSAPSVMLASASNISSNSVMLNGSVNDHFARTIVSFEYDTAADFSHAAALRCLPDTIEEGSGNTNVTSSATGLRTGIKYFYRLRAVNSAGTTLSNIDSFTTAFSLPVVSTDTPQMITPSSALLGGTISATGGAPIIEKGIVWSVNASPGIADNKIIIASAEEHFVQMITGLPQGTTVYARAYAINLVGIAYGNSQSFTTPTTLLSLIPANTTLTNANSVIFSGRTAQPITSLAPADFSLNTTRVTGAAVTTVSLSATTFTVTVNTGTGDGTIALNMLRAGTSIIPVFNLPFTATGVYIIDKTPPELRAIRIADTTAKIGDTLSGMLTMQTDSSVYRMISGKINNINVSAFTKWNDSTYGCQFVIPSNGNDVVAGNSIPVQFTLMDSAGNSASYTRPVIAPAVTIDANKPYISSLKLPPDKLYKAGDTLEFVLHFNERINLTQTATSSGFSVTIGSRTRLATYYRGSGTDSIAARYIIQPGESDKDGIRLNSPLSWLHAEVRDLAGNPAWLTATIPSTKNIMVDGIAPVITSVTVPSAAVYRTGNMLDFIVNFSEKVWVDGNVSIPMIIGEQIRSAQYLSGSGSNALLFRYSIRADDIDKDGIKLGNILASSSARIVDEAGNPAELSLNNIGALSQVFINPPTAAAVSLTVMGNGWYKAGDTLSLQLAFNEKIFVQGITGIPSVKLVVGSSTRHAYYSSGSGSNNLLFNYIIQAGDADTNGIQALSALSLNGSMVTDNFGNTIAVSLPPLAQNQNTWIDAVNPAVRSLITPPKKIYREDDTLFFIVNFTENVFRASITDSPYLVLTAGGMKRKAIYAGGDSSTALIFRYAIQPGDLDKNGIKLDSIIYTTPLALQDIAGNPLLPLLKNIGALSGVKIDGVPPRFLTERADTILCENNPAINISALLNISDDENNEDLIWRLHQFPLHGSLSKTQFTTVSNGGTVFPPSLLYQPVADFNGTDSLVYEVSDGVHITRKKNYFIILPSIRNNTISGPQQACAGSTALSFAGSQPTGGNDSYNVAWEISTLNDTLGFLKAPGIAGLYSYASGTLNTNTWLRRIVKSGACINSSSPVKITVLKNGFWTGGYDTEWNNTNNWCGNIIPLSSTDVIIDGSGKWMPVINDSAFCNGLLLQNNALLTVKGSLQLSGAIRNMDGSIDATNGTLIVAGNIIQSLPAAFIRQSIRNLIISNAAGLALQSPLTITGQLHLQRGVLFSNNQLSLSGKATIAASAPGTGIKGSVMAEHYVIGGRRAFHLVGHPFAHSISLNQLTDSIDITGQNGAANGFTTTAANEPSAFYFNPANTSDSSGADAGWTAFRNTGNMLPDAWEQHTGIRLFIRGRKGQGLDGKPAGDGSNGTYYPGAVTLQLSGPVHTGNVEVVLPATGRAGYHTVANPYIASIEPARISCSNAIARNYWTWDPQLGRSGGYLCSPFIAGKPLAPFSAFIVRTNGITDGNVLFTENCKTEKQTDGNGATTIDHYPFIELQLEKDSVLFDRLLLLGIDSARTYFDSFDGEKLMNTDANLYSFSRDQKKLSVDARPINKEAIIPLGIEANETGLFRIKVAGCKFISEMQLQLHDILLKQWMPLEKDSSYSFGITNDTASTGSRRFEICAWRKTEPDTAIRYKLILRLSPQPVTDQLKVQFEAPEAAATSLRLMNIAGNTIKTYILGKQLAGQFMIPVAALPPGLYLIELRSGDHLTTGKFIRQ